MLNPKFRKFQKDSQELFLTNQYKTCIPGLDSKLPTKGSLVLKHIVISCIYASTFIGFNILGEYNSTTKPTVQRELTTNLVDVGKGYTASGCYVSLIFLLMYVFYYKDIELINSSTKVGIDREFGQNQDVPYEIIREELESISQVSLYLQKFTEGWTVGSLVLFFASLAIGTPFAGLLGHNAYTLFQRYLILNAKNDCNKKILGVDIITGKVNMFKLK